MGFFASPLQPNQRCRLNATNLCYMCALALIVIPVAGFLIFEAQSVYEYGISVYSLITLAMLSFFYVTIVYEMGIMLKLIEKYEEIIENRKYSISNCHNENLALRLKFTRCFQWIWIGIACKPASKATYIESNANIEQASKIFHFMLTRVIFIGTNLPLALLSLANYFVFGSGEKSFLLPCPLLWVQKSKSHVKSNGFPIRI